MTPLGKPLVFYLKYYAEMERLYGNAETESEELDLMGLDNADNVLEMARIVGAAASQQAADFLDLCGKGIEDHFIGLGITTIGTKKTRASVVRNWEWGARIHVASGPGVWLVCGAFVTSPSVVHSSVAKDVCGAIVPWLWSKGGRKGAEEIRKVVGGWAASRASEGLDLDNGTIALACIPVKAQPPESFDVDRDQLIAEVTKSFAVIGAEQTRAIASLLAGLNEAND